MGNVKSIKVKNTEAEPDVSALSGLFSALSTDTQEEILSLMRVMVQENEALASQK